MQLINTRNFVDAFSTRNVVFENFASYDKVGTLIFRTCLEFGSNGRIKRTAVIKTEGMSVHNIHTAVGHYQAEVLAIIDILESFQDWMRSSTTEVFSEFVGDDSPLYFHGHKAKGYPILSIFGKELNSLELFSKGEQRGESNTFADRINALAECYRQHLKDLDRIPVETFCNAFLTRKTQLGNADKLANTTTAKVSQYAYSSEKTPAYNHH